jgi:hypothetical protein
MFSFSSAMGVKKRLQSQTNSKRQRHKHRFKCRLTSEHIWLQFDVFQSRDGDARCHLLEQEQSALSALVGSSIVHSLRWEMAIRGLCRGQKAVQSTTVVCLGLRQAQRHFVHFNYPFSRAWWSQKITAIETASNVDFTCFRCKS